MSEGTFSQIEAHLTGRENITEGSVMNLAWRLDCEWPRFVEGRYYYIIARDGIPYKDVAGERR